MASCAIVDLFVEENVCNRYEDAMFYSQGIMNH